MPPTRSRTRTVVACSLSLLMAAGLYTAVAAADSPEAAVNEVLDDAAAVFAAQLQSDGLDVDVDDLQVVVRDRNLEVISNDGQTAVVRVTATMETSFPEDQVEGVVRAMVAADRDPDEPVTEEEMAFGLAVMGGVLNGTNPVDEEVTVVLEDGEWVFSSGFGIGDEPDPGFEPSISTEGLCGYALPDELSALGELEYDSSNGFEFFCSYSNSDYEDYHSTTVSLELDEDAEYMAGFYGADQPLEVAGAPAFASGPESTANTLITQAGQDVLLISVALPESWPEGADWLTQASLVAELFVPRVPDARLELAGPTPPPTPEPTPEISLCEALPLAELNELTGLGFDEASGDSTYCGYSSLDGEPGFHVATVSLVDLPMAEYATFLPDLEETTVGDLAAATMPGALLVELPGGSHTLQIGGFVDAADDSAALETDELLRLVAERLAPFIGVPESAPSLDEGLDLQAVDEPGSAPVEDGGPTLARPMCEYLELDAVNALGIVEFDTSNSFWNEHCWLSRSDLSDGYIEVSALLDDIAIDEVRDYYPDGVDATVAGLPAFDGGTELRVETSAGTLTITATMPGSTPEAGLEPRDLTFPVAELVAAAIEADTPPE